MKKILLLFIAIVQLTIVYSQEINYQKTFEEAKSKAALENKPIFIVLASPMHIPAQFANASYATGLDSKDAIEFYNKNFICYSVITTDTAAASQVRKIISTSTYPTYIFLDSKGELVYKSTGNAIMSKRYMDMGQQVLDQIASGKTIGHYEDMHKNGDMTAEQLKQYILLRQQLTLYDNASLANEYVELLTVKSFNDYNEVLFILKCGPWYTSKAYKLCYTNPKLIDSIYKNEPSSVMSAVNTRIIGDTRNEAVKTKNLQMAFSLNSFISGIYGKNYRSASQNVAYNMLFYYYGVKDTTNYYRQASSYYDTYYLNISADSAKKLQKIVLDNLKESLSARGKSDQIIPDPGKQDPRKFPVTLATGISSTQSNTVAYQLNYAAWTSYRLGTHNRDYLIKALVWSHRAIELQPEYAYYDTMAHIMYRLDFYDEAQLNQQKAIEMASVNETVAKTEIDHLKEELGKMKERKL